MQIGNLPIAGNVPIAVHNENRQRSNQFKALEIALLEGDLPSAKEAFEILCLNAPNSAQSAQKQREFGHDHHADQQFAVLEYALKNGNLQDARDALVAIKGEDESAQQRDSRREAPDEDDPEEQNHETKPAAPESASTNKNVGVSLDTLA